MHTVTQVLFIFHSLNGSEATMLLMTPHDGRASSSWYLSSKLYIGRGTDRLQKERLSFISKYLVGLLGETDSEVGYEL